MITEDQYVVLQRFPDAELAHSLFDDTCWVRVTYGGKTVDLSRSVGEGTQPTNTEEIAWAMAADAIRLGKVDDPAPWL